MTKLSYNQVSKSKNGHANVTLIASNKVYKRNNKMANNGIKGLVFDVFGTVVDWRTSIAREVEEYLSPKGYKLDWLSFADKWRGKYQPAMEKVRSGGRGFVRLDILHMENLRELYLVQKLLIFFQLQVIQIIFLRMVLEEIMLLVREMVVLNLKE